ncbi:MAG: bifunctional metallophosphatase/5'-nucleotidase [Vicinamibacterales bacterium]
MRRLYVAAFLLCLLSFAGVPHPSVNAQSAATITILHINDVYEIDAIEGGHYGGLSRAATVLRRLERGRAPVLMTLGGDYLSPSAIGTALIDGQPLGGRQMVDVLNQVGLDWAVLGNHEFDVSEAAFRTRLAESRFRVVSSNVTDVNGQPFPGTVRSAIVPIQAGGRVIRLGIIGLTIDSTRRPWVLYAPPVVAAREQLAHLEGKVDAVVALTHLSLAGDQDLVTQVPGIDLVLGGHEHENWVLRRGPNFTPIVKADANARTAAIVTLMFGPANTRPAVTVRFDVLDESVPQDAAVQDVVRKWMAIALDAFRKNGFEPDRVVATVTEPLDGRESVVRNHPGRLTDLITAAFDHEAGGVDVAILNAGSVRIDDVVQPGPVTQYDVLRILPFGGRVTRAAMDGELLRSVLDTGLANRGTGGSLHARGTGRDGNQWVVGGKPLDVSARYTVAMTDFLISGGETNLGFLTRTNPAVHNVQDLRDVRLALIDELHAQYPPDK